MDQGNGLCSFFDIILGRGCISTSHWPNFNGKTQKSKRKLILFFYNSFYEGAEMIFCEYN